MSAVRAAHVSIASVRRAALLDNSYLSAASREHLLNSEAVLPPVNCRQEPLLPSDFTCPAEPMLNRTGPLFPDSAIQSYGLTRGQSFQQQQNLGTNVGLRRGDRFYEQSNQGSFVQPAHPSVYNTSRFGNSQMYQNHYF